MHWKHFPGAASSDGHRPLYSLKIVIRKSFRHVDITRLNDEGIGTMKDILHVLSSQEVFRLGLAALIGSIVGYERQRHSQPAGFRTHTIVALGSALAMCLSIDLATEFTPNAPNGDPARLAAQVISGIGFLGAGAILRYGSTIKGLTTAASLWTVAIIGLTIGAGHISTAVIATFLLLVTLSILDYIEKRLPGSYITRNITLKASDESGLTDELREMFRKNRLEIKSMHLKKDLSHSDIKINILIKTPVKQNLNVLIDILSAIKGIRTFEIH